jgi:TrmH family RNA methyltransferase
MNLLDQVRVVLVEPSSPGNIGATARVMKTTGLSHLVLVNPGDWDTAETRAFAHGSGDILNACRIVPKLQAAVEDCHFVVGTTHRQGKQRDEIHAPAHAVKKMVPLLHSQQVALVFGREKDGLWQDELLYCQQLVCFPSAVSYPSFNLSHAVLLFTYELFKAVQAPPPVPEIELASHAERERMFDRLEKALDAIGFTHYNDNPRQFLRVLRRFFNKVDLELRDIKVILKICSQINRFSLRPPQRENRPTNE